MKGFGLAVTMLVLLLGSMCASVNAQTLRPGDLHAQLKNATPIVTQTACHYWGHCPAGFGQRCAYGRCWCRPC
jgi:hypothetical protein